MKLRIPKSQLRTAIDLVTACVSRTNTLQILDYVLIEPVQGALRISGSDLETTLSVDIPLEGIEPAPPWTAPAHKLKAIAAAAPPGIPKGRPGSPRPCAGEAPARPRARGR